MYKALFKYLVKILTEFKGKKKRKKLKKSSIFDRFNSFETSTDPTQFYPSFFEPYFHQFQVVLIQIFTVMDTAMMKTIIEPVSLTAETAVVPMSIQMTAQNANVTVMLPPI